MSAIAKPLVNFTNSKTPNKFIPVEQITGMDKLDVPAVPNSPASTAVWKILFKLSPSGSNTETVEVDFASSAARNTSFTNAKTALSTAIA
jgi:hypothetical protein